MKITHQNVKLFFNKPLDQEIQSALLRFIQFKEVIPLGSDKKFFVDVRIITATERPLKQMVDEKRFNRGLYQRLSTFTIVLPPLREMLDGIGPLAEKVLRKTIRDLSIQRDISISGDAIATLSNYYWPGNVRELEKVIKRAILFAVERSKDIVKSQDIELALREEEFQPHIYHKNKDKKRNTLQLKDSTIPEDHEDDIETRIIDALNRADFDKERASKIVQYKRNQFTRYLIGIYFRYLIETNHDIKKIIMRFTNNHRYHTKVYRNIIMKYHNDLIKKIEPFNDVEKARKEYWASAHHRYIPKRYHRFINQFIEDYFEKRIKRLE